MKRYIILVFIIKTCVAASDTNSLMDLLALSNRTCLEISQKDDSVSLAKTSFEAILRYIDLKTNHTELKACFDAVASVSYRLGKTDGNEEAARFEAKIIKPSKLIEVILENRTGFLIFGIFAAYGVCQAVKNVFGLQEKRERF